MKCQNCGLTVVRTMKYCPECGQKLEIPASTGVRSEEFQAQSLSLNTLYADFKVSFHDQSTVIININGDEEMKQAITLSLTNGALNMKGQLPGVEIDPDHHSFSLSISNDVTKVNGKKLDPSRKLNIELKLPLNFELSVKNEALGSMIFTNDAQRLVLRHSGYVAIEAKSFQDLEVHVSGMGDLTIKDVAHSLAAHISGSAEIEARSLSGTAIIQVAGSGSFDIDRVSLTTATFSVTASGDVSIGSGNVGTLNVSATAQGNFDFGGHVVTGAFAASGMGDISIGSCSKILKRRESGMGSIDIG